MVLETGVRLALFHTGVCFLFFLFVLSFLVWFFLRLPEEVFTVLFFLHCDNGNFSILMKDIYSIYIHTHEILLWCILYNAELF
jgi:hypothetical protein